MRIAVIGLGVMGAPMARNLLDAGHELRIHRENARSQALVEAGATLAAPPALAGRDDGLGVGGLLGDRGARRARRGARGTGAHADFLFVMVRNTIDSVNATSAISTDCAAATL